MHAVIGRVKIKPGREDETLAMIGERGVAMLKGMAGSAGGYWARAVEGELVQHSFWLFDTEEDARARRRPSTRSATCPMRQRRSSASTFARSSGRRRKLGVRPNQERACTPREEALAEDPAVPVAGDQEGRGGVQQFQRDRRDRIQKDAFRVREPPFASRLGRGR